MSELQSHHCQAFNCDERIGYQFVEYVERDTVPTADGGLYASLLLRFCSPRCLLTHLKVVHHEGDR